MRKGLLAFFILFFGLGAYLWGLKNSGNTVNSPSAPTKNPSAEIDSFEECVKAGLPVMESYPRQCRANSQTFVENIGNELEKQDLIVVDTPRPNAEVNSPFNVEGKARGNWFFEASFPAYLYDEAGNEIASAVVQADGEWMTTDFVPFSFTITYDKPITEPGELVLRKDNPSGLPEHDDELRIPLVLR